MRWSRHTYYIPRACSLSVSTVDCLVFFCSTSPVVEWTERQEAELIGRGKNEKFNVVVFNH